MFLTIILCNYAKLNCLKRTVHLYKNGFGINYSTKVEMP